MFWWKRLFDIFAAAAILLVASPVMVVVALAIRLKLGSPVIFAQERPGLYGKPFKMRKFRTMKEAYNDAGEALPDHERMTRFGMMLRKTSLDELPELFNVLVGDMSMVGPRPLLMDYLPLYSEEQKHRHDVRPGITGLAQVNGRNAVSWPEKFAYDLTYVRSCSFLLDMKILCKTVSAVLRPAGVNHGQMEIGAPRFTGNDV